MPTEDEGFAGPYQPQYAFSANGEGLDTPYRAWRRRLRHVEASSRSMTASVGAPPRRPIKVAVVFPWLSMGGVERWLIGLAAHARGIEWTGLALSENAPFYDEQSAAEVSRYMPIYSAGPRKPYRTHVPTHHAAVLAACGEADVVLCWAGDLRAVSPMIGNRPTVLVAHGSCRWTKKMLRDLSPYCTHYAAVSEEARNVFPINILPEVEVLYNGVEADRCAPSRSREEVRREWCVGEDELLVAYVGRFSKEKNLLAIARAVQGLGEGATAVYIGSGVDEPVFRRQAHAITEGRVRFVAPPDHLGDAYGAIDCLMLATETEGFGLVVAEAWLAGVPVVATNTGIIPEMEALHGPLTTRINHNDPADVLAAAVRIACNQDDRQSLVRMVIARDLVWNEFTAPAMARRWSNWLQDVVKARVPV